MCLVYEAKVFHIFCTLFYRFSHCQGPSLGARSAANREKKMELKSFLWISLKVEIKIYTTLEHGVSCGKLVNEIIGIPCIPHFSWRVSPYQLFFPLPVAR